jgi:hypothetical protein
MMKPTRTEKMAAKRNEPAPTMAIGKGRLAFPYFFEPHTNDDGKARWESVILMPPGFDSKPLLAALEKSRRDEPQQQPAAVSFWAALSMSMPPAPRVIVFAMAAPPEALLAFWIVIAPPGFSNEPLNKLPMVKPKS